MHSKLIGYGPESEYTPFSINDDNTLGGFARLSAIFKNTRSENEGKTLIVDAGDFLMGSLFHVAEEETGFQLNLMKEIGYDVITLGNHEFDFGPQALDAILQNANKKGGYPTIISTNIVTKETMGLGENQFFSLILQELPPLAIFDINGLTIGVFGLMGIEAAEVAPASYPVTFSDPVKSAEWAVKNLKGNHNVDLIICLSHGGVYPSEDGTSYYGEDIDLAEKVPEIDIIISGHTHVKTPEYIKINDTYIVQTGSYAYNVGEIKLNVSNKKIESFDFNLIPVDDKIEGDEYVQKLINEQVELIDKKYLNGTGYNYSTKVAKINYDLKTNYMKLKSSNMGNFVADADKYYLKSKGVDVDFSMVASGTIREDLLKGKSGIITVSDVFRVMSLGEGKDNIPGYPLANIYITAKELKKLCEVLYISRSKGGDGYLYTSGLKIYADPDKGFLKKIQKVELNGKEVDLSKQNTELISLGANGYLLSFLGRIKKMTHGLVKIVPKDKGGIPVTDMTKQYCDIDASKDGIQEAKEWVALIEYMKSFDKGEEELPVVPDTYKTGDESLIVVNKKD